MPKGYPKDPFKTAAKYAAGRRGRIPDIQLYPEKIDIFRDEIAEGKSVLHAMKAAGLSDETFLNYKKKMSGEALVQTADERAVFDALAYAHAEGKATHRDNLVSDISKEKDWRAKKFLLESMHADEFGTPGKTPKKPDTQRTRFRINTEAPPDKPGETNVDIEVEIEQVSRDLEQSLDPELEDDIIDIDSKVIE